MDTAENYKFEGFSLTPSAFAEVALQLAAGRVVRRGDLVSEVVAHHLARGGAPLTTDASRVGKRALSMLEERGLAAPTVAYGTWSFFGEPSPTPIGEDPGDVDAPSCEYVYAYYLPTYRAVAEAGGLSEWPHKVGMTRVSVAARIAAQVGTALPEAPIIELAVQTANASLLERALHSVLELRGKRLGDSPGNEWFTTSRTELEQILAFCARSS